MSSFTIAKQEYMKAAGLVSGIAEELKIWLYDYETRRNSTKEDYKRCFAECYTMNSISVMEQYRGDEVGAPANDTNEYTADFNKYYETGKQLCYEGGAGLLHAIQELDSFFHSAIYQTEKDAYMFKMIMFFGDLTAKMFSAYHKQYGGYEIKSWGNLEIEEPTTHYTPLF